MDDGSYYTEANAGFFSKDWFTRREIILGNSGMKIFKKLFGLKRSSNLLQKVIWKKSYFYIIFRGAGTQVLVKEYSREEETDGAYKSFDRIRPAGKSVVLLKGKPDEVMKQAISNLTKNLKGFSMSKLFTAIFLDSTAICKTDESVERNSKDFPELTPWYYFNWGTVHTPFMFVAQDIFQTRNGGERLIRPPEEKMINIEHADYECRLMSKNQVQNHNKSFLDVPVHFRNQKRINKRRITREPSNTNLLRKISSRDSVLYDRETIEGGTTNLKQVIQHVLETDKGTNNIMINSCCSPVIIGDDVHSLADHLSTELGCNIFSSDVSREDFSAGYKKSIEKKIGAFKKRKDALKENVNLVGFPKESLGELQMLLKLSGINVHQTILPEISDKDFDNYLEAEVQVLFPHAGYAEIYRDIFQKIPISTIKPPAPYGFDRTIRWLETILIQQEATFNEELSNYLKRSKKIYNDIKKQSEGIGIGFILSDIDIEKFSFPEKFFKGIPILSFLEDMGFMIHVAIYTQKKNYLSYKTMIRREFNNKGHSISFIETLDELENFIKRDEIDMIYSDFKYDCRISRVGKNRISISAAYEMGIAGAIRTLKRLLKVNTRRFHKTFAEQFADSYEAVPIDIEL